MLDLLRVAGGTTVGTIYLQTLVGHARATERIQVGCVQNGSLLLAAQLQNRREHETAPGTSECDQRSEEDQKTVLHACTSLSPGSGVPADVFRQWRFHKREELFEQREFPSERQAHDVREEQQVAQQYEQQARRTDAQERQHGSSGFGKRDIGILQFHPLHDTPHGQRQTSNTMPTSESQK